MLEKRAVISLKYCETQPTASIGWVALSSVIVRRRLFARPASVISPFISTIWCFKPYKPYIFCECHLFCIHCWVDPSLLLFLYFPTCIFVVHTFLVTYQLYNHHCYAKAVMVAIIGLLGSRADWPLMKHSSAEKHSSPLQQADCPALSFVFVSWEINIRNTNQLRNTHLLCSKQIALLCLLYLSVEK